MISLSDFGDQRVNACDDILRAFAAGTAVAPDIPGLGQTGGFPALADLRGGDALVVAVVPFGDLGGDGDGGGGAGGMGGEVVVVLGGGLPGEGVRAAEFEELEGALGAGAGGDVAFEGERGVSGLGAEGGGRGRRQRAEAEGGGRGKGEGRAEGRG